MEEEVSLTLFTLALTGVYILALHCINLFYTLWQLRKNTYRMKKDVAVEECFFVDLMKDQKLHPSQKKLTMITLKPKRASI